MLQVASSDKDQKTRIYKLPKKQGAIEGITPKGNPYQKRVVNSYFSLYGKPKEGNAWIPQSPRGLPLLLIPE